LRGEALDRTDVERGGIAGDRSSALFVRGEHAREGKTYRGKEHDGLHLLADEKAARAAAAQRGVDLELRTGERFFDDAPISILLDRWLAELNGHVGYGVEWERFRPNFFVCAADEFDRTESELAGVELRLGSVLLRVRGPIERCVTVTYHPHGEPSDPRILSFLAQRRNAWMGIYCDVIEPGTARVGDTLRES
jgi:uncharacterized protein YcbX